MDFKFIFIQSLSVIAWLFIVTSYYRKNTNKILVFQIIANLTFCIHYLLLGAYSGLFICFIEALCNLGYYFTTKDKFIYLISIPFRIIGGLFTFKIFSDILPIIASLVDGYSLTKEKKFVVIGAIITYLIWAVYDFGVKSYAGVIFDLIIVGSNIFILTVKMKNNKLLKD